MHEHKHYIKHDSNGNVVSFLSDAFGQPPQGFVYLQDGGRHFEWDGVINPSLVYDDGCPIYKGQMERRTDEENAKWRQPDQVQEILKELDELDKILPRYAENLHEQTNTPMYGVVKETFERKKALRIQLQEAQNV